MTVQNIVKWMLDNRAKVLRYTYFLQVFVGMFLMLFGYYTGRVRFDLIRGGARAAGKIVDYKEERFARTGTDQSPFNTAFMPIVEFPAGDRVIRFQDWMGSSVAAELNNTVTVLYDPADPSAAMIDRRVWNWLPWAPVFAVGFFLTVIGIKNLSK
jgi:hypothetical protein